MARSYYSTVVDASADRVWSALRDFNGLATWWSSNVSESHIEDGRSGDAVGAVRSFAFAAVPPAGNGPAPQTEAAT